MSIDLVLGSGSPRRAELLRQLRLSFDVLVPEIPEVHQVGESATEYVKRLSQQKAAAVTDRWRTAELPVLAADTVVVFEGDILEKPKDRQDGLNMLLRLSGKTHQVLTGVTISLEQQIETFVTETLVDFRKLTEAECEKYWDTGEPADKAGGYGAQGLGAIFVSRIDGSYSNVIGLPLAETAVCLGRFGIRLI